MPILHVNILFLSFAALVLFLLLPVSSSLYIIFSIGVKPIVCSSFFTGQYFFSLDIRIYHRNNRRVIIHFAGL